MKLETVLRTLEALVSEEWISSHVDTHELMVKFTQLVGEVRYKMYLNLPSMDEEEKKLVEDGQTILAITKYRKRAQVSLRQAKFTIDSYRGKG